MSAPTAPTTQAVPVIGWAQSDTEWLTARRRGIAASDVSAVLGFSEYATPWEVWADKTGLRPRETDADREAIRLGVALEPWLLRQAGHLLSVDVRRPAHRLYAYPAASWQLCSPDGEIDERTGLEAKTAGLASGFGAPAGWSDTRAPLGYELQCRWQMRVRGYDRVVLVALVCGLGLRRYEYTRDLAIEADMVGQVTEWYQRHIVQRVEPAMGPRDNALMDATYPACEGGEVRLDDDPEVIEALYAYADGVQREAAGRAVKEAATALLKRKVAGHAVGTITNRPVVTWNPRRGDVAWRDLVTDLYELLGWDDPDPDIERYRKPDSRQINVKGIAS